MNDLSLYVLTYNLPKQLDLWCHSFLQAYEETFTQCTKYLVNNSDDPSVADAYQLLIEKYSFTEIRMDQNVGINDARYFVARHFHEQERKYMVFFEDDMLLCEDTNSFCSSGFPRYHKDLFRKAVAVLEKEELDYLKLNFTEVSAQNHDNFVWNVLAASAANHSLMESERSKMLTQSKKTKVKYTGSQEGLAYGVGNYFYCNWPILFTKNANKIFFVMKFERNYEEQWMIMSHLLNELDALKAGCLFLSPVNHYRKYSYGDENRKENASGR